CVTGWISDCPLAAPFNRASLASSVAPGSGDGPTDGLLRFAPEHQRQEETVGMVTDGVAQMAGSDNADQAAMLFIAFEVIVTDSGDLEPGHQRSVTQWGVTKFHPDISAPAFRLGNVDQDVTGTNGQAGL